MCAGKSNEGAVGEVLGRAAHSDANVKEASVSEVSSTEQRIAEILGENQKQFHAIIREQQNKSMALVNL